MKYFAPSFVLLEQEGYLCRSALTAGLTPLTRTEHEEEAGRYYEAFFQLSIGIERVLKLTLILDSMAKNALSAPTSRALRARGHDLLRLFHAASAVASTPTSVNAVAAITADSFGYRLLVFLSSFATSTRYYNLDQLAVPQRASDPLREWQRILRDLNLAHGNLDLLRARRSEAAKIDRTVRASVMAQGLDPEIVGVPDWIAWPAEQQEGREFAFDHIYRLLQTLRELLRDATWEATVIDNRIGGGVAHVPAMQEFFGFLNYETEQARKKQRWP